MANLRADNLCGTGGRNAIDGSVVFTSSTGYLSVTSDTIGTSDFTIEWWFKAENRSEPGTANRRMFRLGANNATGSMSINYDAVNNDIQWNYDASTVLAASTIKVYDNSWYHVAAVREGTGSNETKLYINGVLSDSVTLSTDFTQTALQIGWDSTLGDDFGFYGNISNLRVTKRAIYTAAFTPPTEKYTAVTDTILLCCQDSDDPTQEATGKTITAYGNLDINETEYVTNGTFGGSGTSPGGSTYSPAWTVWGDTTTAQNGGLFIERTSTLTGAWQLLTGSAIPAGQYRIRGTISNKTGPGSAIIRLSSASQGNGTVFFGSYGPGVVESTITYSGSGNLYMALMLGNNTGSADFSNISFRQVYTADENNALPPVGVDEGVTFGGETKHNTQGYMYFPKGDTSQRGRGRGLTGGGWITPGTATATIQSIEIQSEGIGLDFGDLTVARMSIAPMSSVTRGLFAGGYTPTKQDTIDYVEIATTGNAIDFGNMLAADKMSMGASNSTRGLMAGGDNNNVIQYVTMASKGDATDFGDLLTSSKYGMGCASPTRAIWFLGSYPSNVNTIEYTTIATTGNSVDFGDRSYTSSFGGAACASSTRAVSAGGYKHPTVEQSICYVEIATTGNATDFGDLQQVIGQGGSGMSNGSRGVFGGYWGPTTTGAGGQGETNICEYVTIASTGNAKDWGDLYQQVYYCTGVSDSHGGLS